MGRGLLIALLAAVCVGTLAVSGTARTAGGGTPAPAAFRLSDGSAGCAFDGSRLACATAAGPTAVLEADGDSHPAGDAVAWDDSTPVLRRTEGWFHGGFSCHVADSELVCERESGSITVGAGGVGGASSASH